MRKLLITISFLGLALTVVPAFLVYHEIIDFTMHKTLALIGTLLWLGTAPFWMNKKKTSNA
ncbi:MAG: hypothetical protein AAF223_13815 [Bacteroidota bacterium]